MPLTCHNHAQTKKFSRSGQAQVWISAYLMHPTVVIFISNDLVTFAIVILYLYPFRSQEEVYEKDGDIPP